MSSRRHATRFLAALALMACTGLAHAQAYPAKSIRWIVPYPAGGGSDFLARTVAQQLSAFCPNKALDSNHLRRPELSVSKDEPEIGHATPIQVGEASVLFDRLKTLSSNRFNLRRRHIAFQLALKGVQFVRRHASTPNH